MVLWKPVRLQGIVRALHLNGQLGIVEEVDAGRATVRLLSGPTWVKPEHVSLLGLQNCSLSRCCNRAVKPAGASASGTEVVSLRQLMDFHHSPRHRCVRQLRAQFRLLRWIWQSRIRFHFMSSELQPRALGSVCQPLVIA